MKKEGTTVDDQYKSSLNSLSDRMSCLIVNCLSARATLGILAFFMFLVTQMIRVNLYIAVVAFNEKIDVNGTDQVFQDASWDKNAHSLVLGAFYWSYWATELPGGLLAQRYGGKRIMGLGVTVAAIANLLLPAACKYHYFLASGLRALQGLALGVTWPVMHWLSARWIPKTERSKFMTSYHGGAIGSAITYPISGVIITHYGWEFVFYAIGVVTLIWCFAWWILVYDSPKLHPRLSDEETKYLAETIGDTVATNKPSFGLPDTVQGLVQTEKPPTPWKDILCSKSFWAVLIASQGLMWGTITLSMQTPVYFRQVHKLDIKSMGYLSGLPEISKFLFSVLFSVIIDRMITGKVISVTVARKLAVAVSEYLPAKFLILLGLFGSTDVLLATMLLTFTSLAGGGSSSGSLANIVDLSPNHAGTLLGITKTLTIIPGVLSPIIVIYLTSSPTESKATQWRNVLFFIAVIYIICSTIFLFYGSGEVQPWNQNKTPPKEESKLLEKNKEQGKVDNKNLSVKIESEEGPTEQTNFEQQNK